jgi:hypothetical protein
MPNGRSAGFVIERVDLKQLAQGVSQNALVGTKMTTGFAFATCSGRGDSTMYRRMPEARVAVERTRPHVLHRAYWQGAGHLAFSHFRVADICGTPAAPYAVDVRGSRLGWMDHILM